MTVFLIQSKITCHPE